ncbi:Rrf2 family transcriptional regulator [Listeria sp. PSOL-1]|uniref:Rrf2 family transcriptional regulator n=1 Tax=Listeria sp. PSOL-1 TaxID=1844999 RepID=UPI0013D5CB31|nr:Rrf2 family transcriptional regulator [Listeria sp. PSOL-1]
MKYSVRFSDAIHILSYIEIFQGTDLSSETIARSVRTNPVTVRKIMGDLKKSQLIHTSNGKANPMLSKSATEISLYDIYKSVEKDTSIFHTDKNTAPNCLVGRNIQKVLEEKYDDLQQILEEKMKAIFLAEIIEGVTAEN